MAAVPTIRERLSTLAVGPHAAAYSPVVERLDRFSATTYASTLADSKRALCTLAGIAGAIKAADDEVGAARPGRPADPEDAPAPQAAIQNPDTALTDLLADYPPLSAPVVVADITRLVDNLVRVFHDRPLTADPNVNPALYRDLKAGLVRLGAMPEDRADADELIDALTGYVRDWLT